MKVFLTGGTGFIGHRLTKLLLSRGWSVTALVRNPNTPQAQAVNRMGAHVTTGDITDRESMRADMNGADIVIHNAGHYEYGLSAAGRKRMQAVNVHGTENVLGLALELGVLRALYVSTIQAFGETGSQMRDETFTRIAPCRTTYERTKTDAHAIACHYQQRGLPLIIACPSGVIGPNDHSVFGYFLRLYLNKLMPPLAWSPNTLFSLVEVSDLAKGITLAAEKARPGETYFFCGESKSFREHLDYWARRPGAFKVIMWLPRVSQHFRSGHWNLFNVLLAFRHLSLARPSGVAQQTSIIPVRKQSMNSGGLIKQLRRCGSKPLTGSLNYSRRVIGTTSRRD